MIFKKNKNSQNKNYITLTNSICVPSEKHFKENILKSILNYFFIYKLMKED